MGEVRARTAHRVLLGAAIGVGVLGIAVAPAAFAQDEGGAPSPRDQVVMTGTLVVPAGTSVDSAVIFNGDATIEGSTTGNVVVFNGDVEISGTVGDDVVVFNGHVLVRSGAVVQGDVVSRLRSQIEDGATVRGEVKGLSSWFDLEWFWFVGRFAWWIAYSFSTLALGLGLLLFVPGVDAPLGDAFRWRMGSTFAWGAAIFLLLPIAAVLFLGLVLALPLGLFLLLALALLYTLGYVAGAHALGRRAVKPETSRIVAFLAGWGILRAFGLIPLFGGLIWVLASIAGLGALVIAARRFRPAGPRSPSEPAAPTPPSVA